MYLYLFQNVYKCPIIHSMRITFQHSQKTHNIRTLNILHINSYKYTKHKYTKLHINLRGQNVTLTMTTQATKSARRCEQGLFTPPSTGSPRGRAVAGSPRGSGAAGAAGTGGAAAAGLAWRARQLIAMWPSLPQRKHFPRYLCC